MKKDYIQFGKNRNSRFVLTKQSVKYIKNNDTTVCIGKFIITFRGIKIFEGLEAIGYCKKTEKDEEDEKFAKSLARTRMEKVAYEKFKGYFSNTNPTILYPILKLKFSKSISICSIIYYIMNSVHFADNMIKHQKEYIKTLLYGFTPKNHN